MRIARLLCVLLSLSLIAAACGDDDATTGGDVSTTSPSGGGSDDGGGWAGGEPEWRGGGDDGRSSSPAAAYESDGDAVAGGSSADIACCDEPPIGRPESQGPLRAGSVDDNVDYDDYLDYRERIRTDGWDIRDLDVSGRIVLTVVGSDGRPVLGADVEIVGDDGVVERMITDATGQVIFLPNTLGVVDDSYSLTVDGKSIDLAPGDVDTITLDREGGADVGVPLDIVFLLDVTGSMGDEIDQLKRTVSEVATRIEALASEPDVRFGMTLYRDEGDSFVTATFDLTGNIDEFQDALDDVVADGGGDYPEALDEALAEALDVPTWRDAHDAVQLIFLVADAPPQVNRQQVTPYTTSMLRASARGITIHSIAASNTDDAAEHAFRSIAQATGGRFVFLTYGAGGAATGSSSNIDETDYEELSLDDLVVRLVSEELDVLTATSTPIPSTTTTAPDGQ